MRSAQDLVRALAGGEDLSVSERKSLEKSLRGNQFLVAWAIVTLTTLSEATEGAYDATKMDAH